MSINTTHYKYKKHLQDISSDRVLLDGYILTILSYRVTYLQFSPTVSHTYNPLLPCHILTILSYRLKDSEICPSWLFKLLVYYPVIFQWLSFVITLYYTLLPWYKKKLNRLPLLRLNLRKTLVSLSSIKNVNSSFHTGFTSLSLVSVRRRPSGDVFKRNSTYGSGVSTGILKRKYRP